MNKNRAVKILNLKPDVSFEEAKKAYRNLAKKYHPDIVQRNICQKKNAESKMKEINLAFCYLAPLLKSENHYSNKNDSVKSDQKIKKKKKTESSKKTMGPGFFFKTSRIILSFFKAKNNNNAFKKKSINKKPAPKSSNKHVRFGDVFKMAYQELPDTREQTRFQKTRKYSQKSSYKNYQKYMELKRKMKSGLSYRDQNTGIRRIDKISPVKPVKPVGRN